MKNLIEEATKRLQQLEQAGIQVPRPSTEEPVVQRAAGHAQARVRRDPFIGEERPAPAAKVRVIDFARLQVNGFVTPTTANTKLLHEFRILKRPLIQNALGRSAGPIPNANLIMVTSSLPGEGKSFVSLNLAMSMAMEVDCRVLLVDGDVLLPSLPRLLGVGPAKGLMDVLTTPSLSVEEVLLKTNVPRLDLLLAGTPDRSSSELLASDAMQRLLQELSSRYADRIVVFDSPPLLSTSESRTLATLMGQVVVVVEAERTTHGTLESALSTLESCPVVMTVLNRAPQSESGSYYGSYGHGS